MRSSREEVTVWTDSIIWPIVCPCCLREADQRATYYHTTVTGVAAQPKRVDTCTIPYCSACLWHLRATAQLQGLVFKQKLALKVMIFLGGAIAFAGLLFLALLEDGMGISVGGMLLTIAIVSTIVFAAEMTIAVKHSRPMAKQRSALEDEMEKALTPSCCSVGSAVEFTQKDGAIHSFVFHSTEYAEAFRRLNADNLVGTGLSMTQVKTD